MIGLIINSGSSSLKFRLIDTDKKTHIIKGVFDRIGLNKSYLLINYKNKESKVYMKLESHDDCIPAILTELRKNSVIEKDEDIDFIGHRVVHGGEIYKKAVVINKKVVSDIEALSALAPLHNPANLKGILAFQKSLPGIIQVAVFDTAFHQTLDEVHYLYGIPPEFYKKYGIRKYGFHGTSHKYISEKAVEHLGKGVSKEKIITCHMGNGISLCAIGDGKSIDTSMGFTPLEGPMMGTRSGSLDPAIVPYIMDKTGMSVAEISNFLNKECGIKGILKSSSDIRDVWKLKCQGNKKARLILDVLSKQVVGYIGNYTAQLGGVDVLIFSAGIGEGAWYLREDICDMLSFLGIKLDKKVNQNKEEDIKKITVISSKESKVTVMVVPTNEELEIAMQAAGLLGKV